MYRLKLSSSGEVPLDPGQTKKRKLNVEPSAQQERMQALNQVLGGSGLIQFSLFTFNRKSVVERNC